MIKAILLSVLTLVVTLGLYAQAPQGIPYQAAARGSNGQALVNHAVKVRFSIIDSVATGKVLYTETDSLTTNSVGIFNVNIGAGANYTGVFNKISWGVNYKFIKVELDITATGSSFVNLGTTQMMSVPYSLYSNSSNSINGTTGSNINTLIYTTDGF